MIKIHWSWQEALDRCWMSQWHIGCLLWCPESASMGVQPGGPHQPMLCGVWGWLTCQLQSKPQHSPVLLQCAFRVFSFYIGMFLEGGNNPGVARERVWNLQGLWSQGVWGVGTPRLLWVRRSLPGSLVCACNFPGLSASSQAEHILKHSWVFCATASPPQFGAGFSQMHLWTRKNHMAL